MNLLRDIVQALDIVAFERKGPDKFKLIGARPEWFGRLYPDISARKDAIKLAERFPFLANFLIDAEQVWQKDAGGRLKSGIWMEADSSGTDHQLEASALRVENKSILIIELSGSSYREKQALIQTGRDQKLRTDSDSRNALANLAEMHTRLINTLECMTDGFVSLDKNWRYTYVNRHAAEMFGRKAEDLTGKHIWTEFPEAVGQNFYQTYMKAVEEQKPFTIEEYYPPWNRWFENRIYPLPDGLSIFFKEITDRKRAEAIINGQRELHEMIAMGRSLTETLRALIAFIESQAPEMVCSVLLFDEKKGTLTHGAAPNLPGEIMTAIEGSPIGPKAGSCGTAAFRGEQVFVQDISTDPLWEDYRDIFLQHGLRACWSSPIFDEDRQVIGTFAIYYRSPAQPSQKHLKLIEIATHIAAICIMRHRAEETLRRSEQQLALIYDTVSDIIFLLEVESINRFRFVSVNAAFLVATGLTFDQIVGKYVEDVLPPSAHDLVFKNYKKAIEEKRAVQWEESSVYPAGKKTAIVRVNPVLNENQVCTHLVGAVHDVTEFRQAVEAARKSQVEVEQIYRTAPVGFALVDENLRLLRINEEFAAISGKRPEEHIGKTIAEVFPQFDFDLGATYLKIAETGQPILDIEVHGMRPAQSGLERSWLTNYYPVKAEDGAVRGMGIVFLDITDRAALAELGQMALTNHDVEEVFRAALEIISKTLHTEFMGVLELAPDGKSFVPRATFGWQIPVKSVPAGKQSHAGYTASAGEPVIMETAQQETRFVIPPFMAQHGIVSGATVLIPGKKEPYGVLSAHSALQRDFSPHEVHFLQSIANILAAVVERQKLEHQILQAQKLELIGGMAAGLAHQLNTPLAVIMMRLQMLKDDLATLADTGSLEQIDIIVNSAKKMSAIIQDFLNFSRIPKLQREQVYIDPLLNQILKFVEVRAQKQDVELVQTGSNGLSMVEADKNRLEQAFLNIIVNALDAMPNGGVLSVHTSRIQRIGTEQILIEFRDTGEGMQEKEAEKIFDPFFTTKPAGQGTGLGLAVTYEIVRNHGGEIRVVSRKGEGSTFRVLLPASR